MTKRNYEKRQKASLMKIPVITADNATELIEVGFVTLAHLKRATDNELLAVPGIDKSKLDKIRVHCAGP